MSFDLDIQKAIEAGNRNLETKQLIHNWCRHARVEKFGGTGLIEMETGLPIGHHAMVCDFATASGMATWLLEDAALHFYDINCIGCTKRAPVGLPNISKLLAQRERDAELAEARADDFRRKGDEAFRIRSTARSTLRATLPVLAATFVDDLQALDAERNDGAERRLIENARLAPEILVPELVDHLFSLLESGEHWFDKTGLLILSENAVDQGRLTRCAMHCLAGGCAIGLAAEIVADRVSYINANDVPQAVGGLAYAASPPRSEFGSIEPESGSPDPLARVAEAFPEEIAKGLNALLASRAPPRAGVAARGMALLISIDGRWTNQFVRSLAVHLSRADILIEVNSESELRRSAHDLICALAAAFIADPALTDLELMRQFESASSDGEARLVGVYEHVVSRREQDRGKSTELKSYEPYKVAFRRIAALVESSKNSEVIQHVLSALRHPGESLAPIAKELMDFFLGAAVLIDSQLQSPPPEPALLMPPAPFAAMEQANRRSSLRYIRNSFIALAVQGAGVDFEGLASFEGFLGKRSVLGDSLEAAIIEEISPLMESSAGLRVVLPYLYNAMVGPSTLGRAAAAHAIEEIGNRRFAELPSLVAEALLLMLFDPYVIVHKSAVKALRRVSLPESLDRSVSAALDNLIAAYRDGDDQEFLLECIEAYCQRNSDNARFVTHEGKVIVALLGRIQPSLMLRSGHYHFIRKLFQVEGYAQLVLGLFPHCQSEYETEHIVELVNDIPLRTSGSHLAAISQVIESNRADPMVCGTFVELLTRDGEWRAAAKIAAKPLAEIADTPRQRVRKLFAFQLQCHAEFEHLLSEGRLDEAFSIGNAWQTAEREITEIRERNEKSDPFKSILRAPPSR